jgi:hypothetical protein
MIIRKYTKDDAGAVDEIFDRCHRGNFNRPNLSHVLSAAVVEVNGKIVGFGCLEAILEAVMIIDLDRSIIERVETLRQLLDAAKFITTDKGFERFYMFPSDESFKDMLINRFKMDTCSQILTCEVPLPDMENTDDKPTE